MKNINIEQLVILLKTLSSKDYRFTTITPVSHKTVNARPENLWASDLRDIFGWSRSFRAEIVEPELFELMKSAGILQATGEDWRSVIRVSSIGNFLFAHSAFPTDSNDAIFFGPDTYRYINELNSTLSTIKSPIKRSVDIGTGSGAAAILTAAALPQAEVWGIDINDYALDVAKANAEANGINNVSFKYSNLLNDLDGEFDLIMANPPYLLDSLKRSYRHGDGALGAQLSLDIVDTALERLSVGGTLYLYTGVAIVNGANPFLDEVEQKVKRAGFSYTYAEIDPDIFGEELKTDAYATVDRIAALKVLIKRP